MATTKELIAIKRETLKAHGAAYLVDTWLFDALDEAAELLKIRAEAYRRSPYYSGTNDVQEWLKRHGWEKP